MELVLFLLVSLLTGTLGAFGSFLSELIGAFGGLIPV